jgi:hypothetical protein
LTAPKLPNFLGIGVPRGGSTWLHSLLAQHPDVFVPRRRKEVHYFDRNHDRGPEWYAKFFADAPDGCLAVGEVTPHYLFSQEAPERISNAGIGRLIVTARNPIDRAFSHYGLRRRLDGFAGNFDDFLEAYPQAVEWGLYARALERYLEHFGREQILILIFEEMFRDVPATRRRIAEFLDVDPERFPADAGFGTVNAGGTPAFPRLSRIMVHIGIQFRRFDMDFVPNLVRKIGISRAVTKNSAPLAPVSESSRERARNRFAADTAAFEVRFGLDLSVWR